MLARRVRLLVLCGLIAFLASTIFNIGLDLWASTIVTSILFVVNGFIWLGWGWLIGRVPPRAIAHFTLGTCVVAIALIAYGEGTTRTPNLHFLTLIVVASALLLGVAASRLWTALSIIAASITFAADVHFRHVPADLAANHGIWLALVLLVLHLLASAASRVADASMAESERAAERARKAAAELEAANAALALAVQARSQFLANMSHEIRTPLNAVLGFTDVLLGTSLDNDQRQYVDTIRGAGQGLLVIIDDVLDLARIEAGKLELARETIDLADMVGAALDMLAVAAHKKGVEIWLEGEPGAPTHVEADSSRLRQVLLNLVGNAVKFTAKGHVTAVIKWSPDKSGARIEVHDTGAGIAPSAIGNLFQPFGQEDGSTRRRHGGTGLGLVISKKLVEGMHGTIGFSSELGKGSCFWVELPNATRRTVIQSTLGDVVVGVVEGRELHTRKLVESLEKYVAGKVSVFPATVTVAEIQRRMAGETPSIVIIDWDPAREAPTALVSELGDTGDWLKGVVLLSPLSEQTASNKDRRLPRRVRVMHKPIRIGRLLGRMGEIQIGERPPSIRPPPSTRFLHRVLLVEDNLVNQRIARLMLQSAGCSVEIADNGTLAVAAAAKKRFDLVLMDLHMPEMDGFDAARAIRADEKAAGRAEVPIIALSASVMPEDQVRCREAGMNGHLAKPISQDAVIDLLKGIAARA